jgi:hypothetical protein
MAIFPKFYSAFNPTLIVAPDAAVHQLEFGVDQGIDGPSPDAVAGRNYNFKVPLVPSPSGESDERITLFIKIISGSFKMNVGDDPTGNPLTLVVGDTFTVTIHNRVSNLHFLAAGAGDSFFVSA